MPDLMGSLQSALADRYLFERELGRGGMATVFLARDLRHDRQVAIKVLRPDLAAAVGTDRFLAEIRITARLQHPHIVPLFDSGAVPIDPHTPDSRDLLYYVMPLLEGESLHERLGREGALGIDDALRITRDVSAALGYAHELGVVHRDIKPGNIMLTGGQAVIADFGIARALSVASGDRLTETGLALGTPHYMSPEQAAGDPHVDGRADIYALGCVLYEMLVGEPPYTGPTGQAIIARHMTDSPPPIRARRETVPPAVERAIGRALARIPADRFRTAPEFAAALAAPVSGVPAPRSSVSRRSWFLAGSIVAVAAATVVIALRLRSTPAVSDVGPSASLIAVLPFTPSGTDTALSRLGRDLVFTLSAELDGLGDIRVVDAHTVLAQAKPGDVVTPAEAVTWARRFGAGSIVHGSLVREGPDVRLDFVLLATDSSTAPLARASVSGAADSIAALTDSAVHSLLRQVWTRGSAPTPSLEAALKTRSAPALRAFLEGERQVAGGRWDSAAVYFARAREIDPEFWLAYSREQYAQAWSVHQPVDSLVELLNEHRHDLPEPERLVTEANRLRAHDSISLAIDRDRQLTERYPSSWFGWLDHADELLHNGPLLGYTRDEAMVRFRRALELNPDLIPVHEHLMMAALQDRDTAAASRGLSELTRLDAGPSLTADGYGNRMLQFRFLDAVIRGDSARVTRLTDSLARDPAPLAVDDGSFYDPYRYRFPAQQIAVSSRGLRYMTLPGRIRAHARLITFSWVARGAWDSALVAFDRLAKGGIDSTATLRAYGLAAVGEWLGAVDTGEASRRRPAAVTLARTAGDRAELAWLDGLRAVGRRDRRGITDARTALQQGGASEANSLDRSLAAFATALDGSTSAAGTAMAALEWEQAALAAPDFSNHPYTIIVDRLAAARWLQPTDPAQALRLLNVVDGAYMIHVSTPYSLMLAGLANLERARIEQRLGHDEIARAYYREFLRLYDRPPGGHETLIAEAQEALSRPASRQ